MEIGIDSFAGAYGDASLAVSGHDRLRDLLKEIGHAGEVGLDVFGVGEHHRREYLDSATPLILAAAAARTKRIRLTSAVTVLSAIDPVRLFQSFATLDLTSELGPRSVPGMGRCRRPAGAARPERSAPAWHPWEATALTSVNDGAGCAGSSLRRSAGSVAARVSCRGLSPHAHRVGAQA